MMQRIRTMLRDRRGFTLIELMVVVAIIGILVAIAVPQFIGQTEKAKIARAKADIKTIGSAIELYYAEEGTLPTEKSGNKVDEGLLEGYLRAVPQDPWDEDYYYDTINNATDFKLRTRKSHSGEYIYYPPEP